jgi:Fe-S cluster biosynthesis and repair protein YggX
MPMSVTCARCAQTKTGLARAPYPGALGRQLTESVCAECWDEWSKREVMVINELRLNFMEPGAMDILAQYIRDFFFLPAPDPK